MATIAIANPSQSGEAGIQWEKVIVDGKARTGNMDDIITLQEELQRTRLAYRSAIALARWKSEFLGRAAHELRSPLSSLISLHQLILTDLCESPEEEREFISRAHRSAGKLLGMLDEMIAVSKLESGRIALDLQLVPLKQIFEDLERLTGLLAANRNITLDFRSVSPEIVVFTDFQRLCHALVLILDMAIASFERVKIRIAAEIFDENTVTIAIEIPDALADTSEGPLVTPDADLAAIERWERSLSLSPGLKFEIASSIIDLLNGRVSRREMSAGDDGEKITRIDCSVPRSPVAIAVPTGND